MSQRYFNTTDSSVVIDTDGHAVDGLSFFTAEDSDIITQAVDNGTLMQVDEVTEEDTNQAEEADTADASPETKTEDETLSPKATRKKKRTSSTTQNEEN